jgi:signal transduction histidine kinase
MLRRSRRRDRMTVPGRHPRRFGATTKEVGKGTGQGLAMAHNCVVGKHGGSIDVTSEVGVGTTFCLNLPATVETAPAREGVLAGGLR